MIVVEIVLIVRFFLVLDLQPLGEDDAALQAFFVARALKFTSGTAHVNTIPEAQKVNRRQAQLSTLDGFAS